MLKSCPVKQPSEVPETFHGPRKAESRKQESTTKARSSEEELTAEYADNRLPPDSPAVYSAYSAFEQAGFQLLMR
jgi:hypothetical protein